MVNEIPKTRAVGNYHDFWVELKEYKAQAENSGLNRNQYYEFLVANIHFIIDPSIVEKLGEIVVKIIGSQAVGDDRTLRKIQELSQMVFNPVTLFGSLQKDVQLFIFGNLDLETRKRAGIVSKEWRKLVKDPLAIRYSINRHPEIPILDYGCLTVGNLKYFAQKQGNNITCLNLEGIEISEEELEQIKRLCPSLKALSGYSNVSKCTGILPVGMLNLEMCAKVLDHGWMDFWEMNVQN